MMFCLSLILLGFVVLKFSTRIHKHPHKQPDFQDVGVKSLPESHRNSVEAAIGSFSSLEKLIYLFKYPVHYETSEQKQNWHNK